MGCMPCYGSLPAHCKTQDCAFSTSKCIAASMSCSCPCARKKSHIHVLQKQVFRIQVFQIPYRFFRNRFFRYGFFRYRFFRYRFFRNRFFRNRILSDTGSSRRSFDFPSRCKTHKKKIARVSPRGLIPRVKQD